MKPLREMIAVMLIGVGALFLLCGCVLLILAFVLPVETAPNAFIASIVLLVLSLALVACGFVELAKAWEDE